MTTAMTAWELWWSMRTSTATRSGLRPSTSNGTTPCSARPRRGPRPIIPSTSRSKSSPADPGKFNHWLVNGKEYPHEGEFVLQQGARYRLVFHNKSDDAHPVHLHRHTFELVEVNGKKTSGVIKDTVVVPNYGRVSVDLVADQPGLTLFHCHNQQHMDFGFKALFHYA